MIVLTSDMLSRALCKTTQTSVTVLSARTCIKSMIGKIFHSTGPWPSDFYWDLLSWNNVNLACSVSTSAIVNLASVSE